MSCDFVNVSNNRPAAQGEGIKTDYFGGLKCQKEVRGQSDQNERDYTKGSFCEDCEEEQMMKGKMLRLFSR